MPDQATETTGQSNTEPSGQQMSPPGGTGETTEQDPQELDTGQTGDGQSDTGQQDASSEGDQQKTGEVEIQDFKMPEGIEVDTELAGELKTFAKENGLTQEQAQQIADLGVKMQQKQLTTIAETVKSWAETAKTDKEYGGEAFDANLAQANKALAQFATPEFLQFLQESGLGNHPEMIRTWYRVSKTVSEDRLVTGSRTSSSGGKSLEERLYPNMMNP